MILKNGKRLDGCSDTVPVGTINPYIGSIAPYGYLICEGQLVSKTTYKELYEVCGDKFGTGTETEFRLPDLRGKTIAGYKEGDTLFGVLGKLIGSENHNHGISHTHGVPGVAHTHSTGNHTLTVNEIPNHGHTTYLLNYSDSGETRTNIYGGSNVTRVLSYSLTTYDVNSKGWWNSAGTTTTGGGQAHNHGDTGSTTPAATTTNSQSTTTSGNASSIQPTVVMNWIVKAFLLMPNQSYVENSLTSTSEINSLSAAKGKELNDKINALNIPTVNNTLTSTSTTQALSAAQGKGLNDRLDKLENYKNGETVIGTWTDGKPLYRYITNTTKKDLGTILNSLHIKYLKSTNGSYVTSKWNNSWAIPTAYNPEPDYNLWVMGGNTPGENVQINFGAYYTDSSAVRLVIEYTKTTD